MLDARWGDDPRDADPRDQEPQPGLKGPAAQDRDDTRSLGRGGGSERQRADEHSHDARHDARWSDRERDGHGREREPRRSGCSTTPSVSHPAATAGRCRRGSRSNA